MPPVSDQRHRIAAAPCLRIEAWRDAVVETHGHDPRSAYAARFWLPIVGPSCLVAARSLIEGLGHSPAGYEVELAPLGHALGLPGKAGNQAKIVRTLDRLAAFGLASFHATSTPLYRVRLAWPPLTQRQLARLPEFLVELHPAA
ncbi:MAG TPA: hypothetical protein VM142_11110 [Acidimicrobiales bacterium]|nr:hypothetical protein [Acidimicrobiales bacterium]